MSETKFYFTTTPYIDAYARTWDGDLIDFDEFLKKMEDQARSWGEQGVGRALMMGKEAPALNGEYVLAVGVHGKEKFAAIRGNGGITVTEMDWPDEWDVT